MALSINNQVRAGLRVHSTDYADNLITDKIERALATVNEITGETYTIADYSNATTGNLYYDDLLSMRCLWAIYLELYNQMVARADGSPNAGKHISNVFMQNFLSLLASVYPGLVKAGPNGELTFADKSFAGQDIGINDSRYAGESAIYFDSTSLE